MFNRFKNLIGIGLVAFGLSVIPKARAADAVSQTVSNAVSEGRVSVGTNYGAAFKMMYPNLGNSRIVVEQADWMPTNVFAGTLAFYTGSSRVAGLQNSTVGTNTASYFSVPDTNGFIYPLKCVVQLPSGQCLLMTVSNVISGGIAFNETFGVTVPIGSKIYQMNESNVYINQTTNSRPLARPAVGRAGYPMLIEVANGGGFNGAYSFEP